MKEIEIEIPRWDGDKVLVREDDLTGAIIVIAIHRLVDGRAAGGTRMNTYEDTEAAIVDAQRLASGMTWKWRGADLRFGGAKAVIALPDELDVEARRHLLDRYGRLVAELEGKFRTGPDLGTSSEDMDLIAEHAPGLVMGRTRDDGGAGDPSPYTAQGVLNAMQVVAKDLWETPALADRRVVIQGLGNVGAQLATMLLREQAEVLVCDTNQAVEDACEQMGIGIIDPDQLYETPCDIFAPCAVGGILRRRTIRELQCAAVVGAANNQLLEAEDAERLMERDILYAPDFIVNSGGAIAIVRMEQDGWDQEQVRDAVTKTIQTNLRRVFELARTEGLNTDAAARQLLADPD